MTSTALQAIEDIAEAANDGDVFTRDKTHVDGGVWQAAGVAVQAFPVGSVFIAVVATNPATLLGYGTWSAFGAGRVLVGLDAADPDFDLVEEVGGAKTKALSGHAGTAVGDHSAHAHTAGTLSPSAHAGTAVDAHSGTAVNAHTAHAHDPGTLAVSAHGAITVDAHSAAALSHKHDINSASNATISAHASHGHGDKTATFSAGASAYYDTPTTLPAHTLGGGTEFLPGLGAVSHVVNGPGGHTLSGATTLENLSAHVVTQPAAHVVTQPSAHTMSGNTSSEALSAHSVTQPSAHADLNVVQPYIVCYFWKRTE